MNENSQLDWATKVPLEKVLRHRKEFIRIDDLTIYKRCRVKVQAKGIVERDAVEGNVIRTKKQQVCRAGEFLVAEIDAKVGGYGIVPESLDGAIVSSHYFLYEIDTDSLDRKFLEFFVKTPAFLAQIASQGSTNYSSIRPHHVLEYEIPLPPLEEQSRIVARIEELVGKVEEARELRSQAIQECNNLSRSIIFHSAVRKTPTPMSELVTLRSPDIEVQPTENYKFAGVYSFGRGVFPKHTLSGMDFSYKKMTRLSAGNFVYPKLMAWEGALGAVPENCNGLIVSPEFPVFEVNTEKVLPETLDTYFRTPSVWPKLAEISTGTNMRRRRLHPSNFMKFEFPLPDMETQQKLRKVKNKLTAMESLQTQTATELEALLPAILDKAFKGEL